MVKVLGQLKNLLFLNGHLMVVLKMVLPMDMVVVEILQPLLITNIHLLTTIGVLTQLPMDITLPVQVVVHMLEVEHQHLAQAMVVDLVDMEW